MCKKIIVTLTILIILCFAFTSESFANSVTVSLQVYEIKVSTTSKCAYFVNGEKYEESKNFFVKKGESIVITAEQKNKYYKFRIIYQNYGKIKHKVIYF